MIFSVKTMYDEVSVLSCRDSRIGVYRYDCDDRTYIQILNYDYDWDKDTVREIDKVEISGR